MRKREEKTPMYGNWVAMRIVLAPTLVGGVFACLSPLSFFFFIPSAVFLMVASYFAYARYLFSPMGADVENRIRSLLLDKLDWVGKGQVLDIGCGSAALTIGIAKRFPSSTIVGVDTWRKGWEYSQAICDANARVENVSDRVKFQYASASALPFRDNGFDVVVSNLVFHEVSEAQDKVALITEALRVLKKGGKFAFQDLFYLERLYPSPEALVERLRALGVDRIEFTATRTSPSIPLALKFPFMVGTMGMLSGEK